MAYKDYIPGIGGIFAGALGALGGGPAGILPAASTGYGAGEFVKGLFPDSDPRGSRRRPKRYFRYGDRPGSEDTPNFMVEGDKILAYYKPGTKVTNAPGSMRGSLKDLWYEGVERDFDDGLIGGFDDIRQLRASKALRTSGASTEAQSDNVDVRDYNSMQGNGDDGDMPRVDRYSRYTKAQEDRMDRLGEIGEAGVEESSRLLGQYARGESPLDKLAMRAISGMSKPYQPRYSIPNQQESSLGGILEALSDPDLAELVGAASKKFGPLLEGNGIGRIAQRVKGLFSR